MGLKELNPETTRSLHFNLNKEHLRQQLRVLEKFIFVNYIFDFFFNPPMHFYLECFEKLLCVNTKTDYQVYIGHKIPQGKDNWNSSLNLQNLFDFSDTTKNLFSRQLPSFQSVLISLPSTSKDEIKGNVYIQVAFNLMKAIRKGNMIETIQQIESLLEFIYDEKGDVEFVLSSFTYALQAEEVDKDQIDDIFRVIRNPNLREKAIL